MATYFKIQTYDVGAGGAASIDFTAIPSTYTDLVVKASIRTSTTDSGIFVYLNNDTTNTNYTTRRLFGAGSGTPTSASYLAPYWLYTDVSTDTASTFANGEIYLPNYTDASTAQSISSDVVSENNATGAIAALNAGLWNTTSAVNRITLTTISGTFAQYSTATLYGISKS